MADYELILVGQAIAENSEEIYERFDAIVAKHGDLVLLTVTASGSDIHEAGQLIVKELENITSVSIDRLYPDLVTRADIADRMDVTAQTVGNWVRGTRRASDRSFPEPYNYVAGGVWLWGDVRAWLISTGLLVDDDLRFPTLPEHEELSGWLHERRLNPKAHSWRAAPLTYSDLASTVVEVKISSGRRRSDKIYRSLKHYTLPQIDIK